MPKRTGPIAAIVVLATLVASAAGGPGAPAAARDRGDSGVTVHEWGTFTTVAGQDGQAMQWLPLGGPTDLPCFVHAFQNSPKVFRRPDFGRQLDYLTARTGLQGTVRMETPVLYFYASQPATVDVEVKFKRGLFTEWYPNALVGQLNAFEHVLAVADAPDAGMWWKGVQIRPGADPQFLHEDGPSHYYAARATDATPIEVNGEREKFLFYRGVAGFDPPITTRLDDTGAVTVRNTSAFDMPSVILFTKQGGKLGYRVHGRLSANGEVVLKAPSMTGTFASLREHLERTLVAQGLYDKEARAMVDTWRDSWFEDGTRVLYIVPTATVEEILPLRIDPQPAAVARVFVGRMDVITPFCVRAVTRAFIANDRAGLERYGRLLGPIADRILASTSDRAARARMVSQLNAVLNSYADRASQCGATAPTTASAAPWTTMETDTAAWMLSAANRSAAPRLW